ncbi:hypothetical protein F0562_034563 [Nyssa sinensis]|uniref:Uncharacterized protein n=1 Tax=Nyssa sinensis TaxID=561372 RepID=A0A5J5AII9_9ASTE|nr:hypothetical protein F0562_034563 [Nyssa sinensis]
MLQEILLINRQSERHVGPAVVDAAEDLEVDVAEGGGVVPDEAYLVDQMPPQYRRDPSPSRPFHSDPRVEYTTHSHSGYS